jgi:hypothetical protein
MALLMTFITGLGLMITPLSNSESPEYLLAHPDHGVSFHEQIVGNWQFETSGLFGRQLTVYEDGRFAFRRGRTWRAGSYYVLRTDERSTGVLRLEYYRGGNLHLQQVRVEIVARDHGHAILRLTTLPFAGKSLRMEGDFLRMD